MTQVIIHAALVRAPAQNHWVVKISIPSAAWTMFHPFHVSHPGKFGWSFQKSRFQTSTRWFKPWPFHPQMLEVMIRHWKGHLNHPKKVTSRMARYFPIAKIHGYDFFQFPGFFCLGGAMVCSRGWTSGRSRCWSGQLDNPITFFVVDDSFNVGRIWWVGLWNCIFLVIWLMENIYRYTFYNWTIFPLSK